jgi:chromosome segregation ATPase
MSESEQVNGSVEAPLEQPAGAPSAARSMESALLNQRAELARMMQELKLMQEAVRGQGNQELEKTQQENEQLRRLLDEQDRQGAELRSENQTLRRMLAECDEEKTAAMSALEAASKEPKTSPILEALVEEMKGEISALREKIQEKRAEIKKLRDEMYTLPPGMDAESLEADLIRFRHQLEADRKALGKELAQIRERNDELEEARREMELELSRERAELSRERTHLERMREEVRQDMERVQRDSEVRERLAPVHQLRDQIVNRRPGQQVPGRPASMPAIPAPPLPAAAPDNSLMSRLRNIRKGLSQ